MKAYEKIGIGLLFMISLLGCQLNRERILFSTGRSGSSNIYMMNTEGYITNQITDSATEEWAPVWVNKDEIAYLSQEGGNIFIIRKNLKTGEQSRMDHPSPCYIDDKNIAFAPALKKQLYGCNGEIYLLDEITGEIENLTEDLSGTANYYGWDKGESEISFTSNHEGNNDIYRLNLKDKRLVNLTNHVANDERGDISPNGRYLVFSTSRYEAGNQEIAIQDLKTGQVERITHSAGTELIARWSADGKRIYFGSNKDEDWEIYSYDLKKQKERRLTRSAGFDGDPRIR